MLFNINVECLLEQEKKTDFFNVMSENIKILLKQ